MEICFSFDASSLRSCSAHVKSSIQNLIQLLKADIPTTRMTVDEYADHCVTHTYITKQKTFSSNVDEVCDWVKNVAGTGGGDGDEWYELVVQDVPKWSWTPGSKRAPAMIGDADPHEPGKTYNNDWRDENVRVYRGMCGYYGSPKEFYKRLAAATDGKCPPGSFANGFDFRMAICYREHDETLLKNYENEVISRGSTTIHKDLYLLFGNLSISDLAVIDTVPAPLTAIPSVTKTPSVQVLKPSSTITLKGTRKPRTTRFKAKHSKMMEKRNEQILEKYKL